MAEVLKFLIEVDGASGEAAVKRFGDSLGGIGNKARTAADSTAAAFSSIGSKLTNLGATLSLAVTAPLVAIGGVGLAFNAMEQSATIAFTNMMGSASAAKTFIEQLKDFASKTPFEFPGLVTAAQRMMAMGFEANAVIPS